MQQKERNYMKQYRKPLIQMGIPTRCIVLKYYEKSEKKQI